MTKTYCDRCGKECDTKELGEVFLDNLPGMARMDLDGKLGELCPVCLEALRDFFKPLPIMARSLNQHQSSPPA